MNEADARAYRQGRRRLRALLPAARVKAQGVNWPEAGTSALAKAAMPHVREDNMDSLVITPAPLGGWHCDLVFKHVPPGVADTLGTPVALPLRTEREAEDYALVLLAGALVMEAQHRKAPPAEPPSPAFLLHGLAVPMPAEVFAASLATMPEERDGYGTKERAVQRIEEVLASLLPGGVTYQAVRDLPLPEQAELVGVLMTAALTGVFAYPHRRDASPSGHAAAEHSAARH